MTKVQDRKRGRPKTANTPLTRAEAQRRLDEHMAITLGELAVILGMSHSSIHRAAVSDSLPVPAYQIGQRWVIPSEPVRALLKKGKEVA